MASPASSSPRLGAAAAPSAAADTKYSPPAEGLGTESRLGVTTTSTYADAFFECTEGGQGPVVAVAEDVAEETVENRRRPTRGERSLQRKLEAKALRKAERVGRRGLTPLHYAAGALDTAEVRRLLGLSPPLDTFTEGVGTVGVASPLIFPSAATEEEGAAAGGALPCAAPLASPPLSASQRAALLWARDVSGATPLHHAVLLQKVRVDPWREDKASLLAASLATVRALLCGDGSDASEMPSTNGLTASVTEATDEGPSVSPPPPAVTAGALVAAADAEGRTALHLAAGYCGSAHMALLLSAVDTECSPLHSRAFSSSAFCSSPSNSLLLAQCIDAADATGKTPLMEAAKTGNVEAIEALLRRGASVSAEDAKGWTALSYAEAHLRTKQMILEKRHRQRQQQLYQQYQAGQQQQPQPQQGVDSFPAGPPLSSLPHRPHQEEEKVMDSIRRGETCVELLRGLWRGDRRVSAMRVRTEAELPLRTK